PVPHHRAGDLVADGAVIVSETLGRRLDLFGRLRIGGAGVGGGVGHGRTVAKGGVRRAAASRPFRQGCSPAYHPATGAVFSASERTLVCQATATASRPGRTRPRPLGPRRSARPISTRSCSSWRWTLPA